MKSALINLVWGRLQPNHIIPQIILCQMAMTGKEENESVQLSLCVSLVSNFLSTQNQRKYLTYANMA